MKRVVASPFWICGPFSIYQGDHIELEGIYEARDHLRSSRHSFIFLGREHLGLSVHYIYELSAGPSSTTAFRPIVLLDFPSLPSFQPLICSVAFASPNLTRRRSTKKERETERERELWGLVWLAYGGRIVFSPHETSRDQHSVKSKEMSVYVSFFLQSGGFGWWWVYLAQQYSGSFLASCLLSSSFFSFSRERFTNLLL